MKKRRGILGFLVLVFVVLSLTVSAENFDIIKNGNTEHWIGRQETRHWKLINDTDEMKFISVKPIKINNTHFKLEIEPTETFNEEVTHCMLVPSSNKTKCYKKLKEKYNWSSEKFIDFTDMPSEINKKSKKLNILGGYDGLFEMPESDGVIMQLGWGTEIWLTTSNCTIESNRDDSNKNVNATCNIIVNNSAVWTTHNFSLRLNQTSANQFTITVKDDAHWVGQNISVEDASGSYDTGIFIGVDNTESGYVDWNDFRTLDDIDFTCYHNSQVNLTDSIFDHGPLESFLVADGCRVDFYGDNIVDRTYVNVNDQGTIINHNGTLTFLGGAAGSNVEFNTGCTTCNILCFNDCNLASGGLRSWMTGSTYGNLSGFWTPSSYAWVYAPAFLYREIPFTIYNDTGSNTVPAGCNISIERSDGVIDFFADTEVGGTVNLTIFINNTFDDQNYEIYANGTWVANITPLNNSPYPTGIVIENVEACNIPPSANTAPAIQIININGSSNNSYIPTQTPEVQFNNTDVNGDNLTCNLYINSTSVATLQVNNGSGGIIPALDGWMGQSDGGFWFNVTCTDGTDSNSSGLWYMTIDTTPPNCTCTQSPSDLNFTHFGTNITITCNCSDTNSINHTTASVYHSLNHSGNSNWSIVAPANAYANNGTLRGCNRFNKTTHQTLAFAFEYFGLDYLSDIYTFAGHDNTTEKLTVTTSGPNLLNMTFTSIFEHLIHSEWDLDRHELQVENKTGQTVGVYGDNIYAKKFTHGSNDSNTTYSCHFYGEDQNSPKTLNFYNCNASLISEHDPDPWTYDYCEFISSFTDITYNYTARNSSYANRIQFTLNDTGYFGNIEAKPEYYILAISPEVAALPKCYNLFYANNTNITGDGLGFNNINRSYYSTDAGDTWTVAPYSLDIVCRYAHENVDTIEYFTYLCDNLSNCIVPTLTKDILGDFQNLAPEIIITAPVENESIHATYNITIDATDPNGDTMNYTYLLLNTDGTLNSTLATEISTKYYSWDTTTVDDGLWMINVTATDQYGLNNSDRSFNFTVDNTNPIITEGLYPPSSGVLRWSNTVDGNNISWDTQVSDTNLYQIYMNITNSSNLSIFDYYMTDWNSSTFNFSTEGIQTNISTWDEGNYTINITVSDDHTADKIKDYKHTILSDGFSFNTTDNLINITVEAPPQAQIADFIATKKTDRYTLEFIPQATLNQRYNFTFYISAQYPITHRKYSEYLGHFTTGNNWIDFENNDDGAIYGNPVKISDTEYSISIYTDDLNFSSLGGLNIVSELYTLILDNSNPSNKITTYHNLTEQSTFSYLTNITIRANVTDSVGLSNVTIMILQYNGTVLLDNVSMYNITQITNGSEYEYNYTLNESSIYGNYTIWVFSNDTTGNQNASSQQVTVNLSIKAYVSPPSVAWGHDMELYRVGNVFAGAVVTGTDGIATFSQRYDDTHLYYHSTAGSAVWETKKITRCYDTVNIAGSSGGGAPSAVGGGAIYRPWLDVTEPSLPDYLFDVWIQNAAVSDDDSLQFYVGVKNMINRSGDITLRYSIKQDINGNTTLLNQRSEQIYVMEYSDQLECSLLNCPRFVEIHYPHVCRGTITLEVEVLEPPTNNLTKLIASTDLIICKETTETCEEGQVRDGHYCIEGKWVQFGVPTPPPQQPGIWEKHSQSILIIGIFLLLGALLLAFWDDIEAQIDDIWGEIQNFF